MNTIDVISYIFIYETLTNSIDQQFQLNLLDPAPTPQYPANTYLYTITSLAEPTLVLTVSSTTNQPNNTAVTLAPWSASAYQQWVLAPGPDNQPPSVPTPYPLPLVIYDTPKTKANWLPVPIDACTGTYRFLSSAGGYMCVVTDNISPYRLSINYGPPGTLVFQTDSQNQNDTSHNFVNTLCRLGTRRVCGTAQLSERYSIQHRSTLCAGVSH